MSRKLLLIAAVCIIGIQSQLSERYYVDVLLENMPDRNPERLQSVKQFWYEQKLDHFSSDPTTWWQQAFVDDSYFTEGGPVFLYMGGEGPESSSTFYFAWASDYARQFGALCFLLEHRFYGESEPINNPSSEELKYLSAQQALADAKEFIESMNAQYNLPAGTKWITFGGSYPGTLAAWMRQTYPDQVYGAISSSAPLQAEADFDEYMGVVRKDLDPYPGCNPAIEAASTTLRQWFDSGASGQSQLCQLFSYCGPYDETNFAAFYFGITTYLMSPAQYNDFNSDYVGRNIELVCDIMSNEALGDPVVRLSVLIDSMKRDVKSGKQPNWWTNQKCDEFGWFKTSTVYNNYVTFDFVANYYCSYFGSEYNAQHVNEQVITTNFLFQGKHPDVTNVVYVNGLIDPWSAMGLTEAHPDPSVAVVTVETGSHCQNMYVGNEIDWPEMAAAKDVIRDKLAEWTQ